MSSRVSLFPFPRMPEKDVSWSEWECLVDGTQVPVAEVAENWDYDSELAFRCEVTMPASAVETLDGNGIPKLSASVSCRDTAFEVTATEVLVTAEGLLRATAELTVPGESISQRLQLDASVHLPIPHAEHDASLWLHKRIIAQLPTSTVPLDPEVNAFPTVAYSFDSADRIAAPWFLEVLATDFSDAFSNSVRLHLNTDYRSVQSLILGKALPHVESALRMHICRSVIASISRLAVQHNDIAGLDGVADEFPDSIAAGAKQIAQQILHSNLSEAARMRSQNEREFEMRLSYGTGFLRSR